tara:strand:- start:250 stop:474 length:225 start_codon:yes stop_codon:yes gene_type:complete
MRILIFFFFLLLLDSCSLNKKSNYWTEDNKKKTLDDKRLKKIINKSKDIRFMTLEEYEIYINDLIKKSKYPNID